MTIRETVAWKDIPREERVKLIHSVAESGLSYGDLCDRLMAIGIQGHTRSGLIGFVHRNMPGLFTPRERVTTVKKQPKRQPRPRRVQNTESRKAEKPGLEHQKTILDLGFLDCRFPMWEGRFDVDTSMYCGCRVASPGEAYCAYHASRMQNQNKGRKS